MEQAIANAAIQMAGIAIVGAVFLQVLKMVLNQQGEKMERMSKTNEALALQVRDLTVEVVRLGRAS